MEKIRIEGAKLSQELVTIHLRHLSHIEKNLSRLCEKLSDNQVNMQFLSTVNLGSTSQITCCVDSDERDIINTLIGSNADFSPHAEIIEPTGLLTLFPHNFSLRMLGLVLGAFGKSSLTLYGLASSLSSLTCILDFHDLDRALECLREKIDIASEKIERRPKIRIRQTRLLKQPG